MATPLRLDDLRRAWDARDPKFVDMVVRLAEQPDEEPEQPIRDGAPTFAKFLQEMRSWQVRRKPAEEQAHWRQEAIKALEAPTAEVPLPARLQIHELIYTLWTTDEPFARRSLLDVIARVPLVYGPWRALKRIFKEAEGRPDTEVYGALAARFDMAFARGHGSGVSRQTLGYLVRRAWRFLRRTAVQLPATYADVATDFLTRYTDDTNWRGTWVANHVFYHESKQYGRHSFHVYSPPTGGTLKNRAYPDLWQRSPRPLFALLERAQADPVFQFATDALKTDFRALLREVEPDWVARLVNVNSKAVHSFVVWVLTNVPRFEQGKFRDLGLHEPVLRLFDSPSDEARKYAADYARTHARDLPVEELVRLANNAHDAVRKLAADLLLSRDARKDVGLDAWGRLLETDHGHSLAADVLKKHFGPKELTPEWFADRLFSPSRKAFQFAKGHLPTIHPPQKLGADFFTALIDRAEDPADAAAQNVVPFALSELNRFDLNALDPDFLKRLLLHPLTQRQAVLWVNEGRLKLQSVGVEFLKTVAFHPAWDGDPWLTGLKAGPRKWGRELQYSEPLGDTILEWLADVRRFTPGEVGMDWLLTLVQRGESRYHDFAVERLIKSFAPSDFAPQQPAKPQAAPQAVDLNKASFVFTGKLATMVRKEAEEKVKTANGTVAGSVTKNLHYLVIGDEGSPLYGAGKKGDKQLKAEDLNSKGANIRIISETAFLQMLVRGAPAAAASDDATLAGCERLWQMVVAPGPADAPLGAFARKYIRRHHPEIAPAETDRPVDPGHEVPPSFLTFERVKPLFAETRKPLREFALDLAKWEFARWSPPAMDLVHLCELPFPEVRRFIGEALLADDHPKHAKYRINPDTLSPAGVYAFCESTNEATRALGMQLIDRSPRLRVPEELFRLTESPDRKVRAFVIRALWSLYRDRGVTPDWKPSVPPQTTVSEAARKAAAAEAERRGPGVPPKPEKRPADDPELAQFLRRILFEIPPGRMEPASEEDKAIFEKLKPLPARRAKLSLVEVMRDLAVEDATFAGGVLPVLTEFMASRGPSERDACLVAVTRIRARHVGTGLRPVQPT
jgi:hypothetical protein